MESRNGRENETLTIWVCEKETRTSFVDRVIKSMAKKNKINIYILPVWAEHQKRVRQYCLNYNWLKHIKYVWFGFFFAR